MRIQWLGKSAAVALLLICSGCSVTKGFTEATYNHLNQGAPLNHAEYQQELSRISGGDEGKRP
ncbi:MAG: hypothetical protein HYS23_00820 [Geobacter sp.]|nr:hypothetical protein [Geobacter sp.]